MFERTIEELLGFSTEDLLKMTPEDLEKWQGDALIAQEEILKTIPKPRGTQTGTKSVDLRNRNAMAMMPDKMRQQFQDMQARFKQIQGD